MIAGGKLSLSHTVAGQPAVRVRLPVPIASVWLPAEKTQPGAFVCRLFIIAGLFLVFRQLPPVGVAVDLVLQLLPERLRGRRLLSVRGDGAANVIASAKEAMQHFFVIVCGNGPRSRQQSIGISIKYMLLRTFRQLLVPRDNRM